MSGKSDFLPRLLTGADAAALDAFLLPYTAQAYFARSNARLGGLDFQGRPYQSDYFGAFRAGALVGVLAHSWIGTVQIFVTAPEAVAGLAGVWRAHLQARPRAVEAFLGPAAMVEALRAALGIAEDALRPGVGQEGLFTLELARMNFAARAGWLVRGARDVDARVLIPWRHDFYVEALGETPGAQALDKAEKEIRRRVGEGDLFVLEVENRVVSFCGAGGGLPDWKVVGPVWTPPEQRGRGYARFVTGGALAQLREGGATRAVLFTLNPAAERAYRALGFARVGDWRLDFLKTPVGAV